MTTDRDEDAHLAPSCFVFNGTESVIELEGAVSERLKKVSGLLTLLIEHEPDSEWSEHYPHAFWAIRGLADEALFLHRRLFKRMRGSAEKPAESGESPA